MDTNDKVLLGTFSVMIANRYRDLLQAKGVELAVLHNAATCSTGSCGTSMELWAERKDLDAVLAVFQQEQARNFMGLEVNPDLLSQVYDPSQDNAVCPACGTSFSTSLAECPDCGLSFSVP